MVSQLQTSIMLIGASSVLFTMAGGYLLSDENEQTYSSGNLFQIQNAEMFNASELNKIIFLTISNLTNDKILTYENLRCFDDNGDVLLISLNHTSQPYSLFETSLKADGLQFGSKIQYGCWIDYSIGNQTLNMLHHSFSMGYS